MWFGDGGRKSQPACASPDRNSPLAIETSHTRIPPPPLDHTQHTTKTTTTTAYLGWGAGPTFILNFLGLIPLAAILGDFTEVGVGVCTRVWVGGWGGGGESVCVYQKCVRP